MKIGYFAVGIGLGADPENVTLTAQTAEQTGFHSLWAPEHVVLINKERISRVSERSPGEPESQ